MSTALFGEQNFTYNGSFCSNLPPAKQKNTINICRSNFTLVNSLNDEWKRINFYKRT